MVTIYTRIITETFSSVAEASAKHFLRNALASVKTGELLFSPFVAYWKDPMQGELCCHFQSSVPKTEIQRLFATIWQTDTADSQWSDIHCPGAVFLWVSE